MADIRIKVAKDKEKLVKSLRATDDNTSPFQSYADVLVFAAALGIKQERREPIHEYSKEIDPIRQDVFYSKGYDQAINLLGIAGTNNPKILGSNDEAEAERIKVFEEYANAGLETLAEALKGVVDYSEQFLIFLSKEKSKSTIGDEEFDLTHFL